MDVVKDRKPCYCMCFILCRLFLSRFLPKVPFVDLLFSARIREFMIMSVDHF